MFTILVAKVGADTSENGPNVLQFVKRLSILATKIAIFSFAILWRGFVSQLKALRARLRTRPDALGLPERAEHARAG